MRDTARTNRCRPLHRHKKVLAAKEQYDLVKEDRKQAQADVLAHGRVIAKLKREEAEAAERITDDHVDACEQGKALGDIFPSIQVRKYVNECCLRHG